MNLIGKRNIKVTVYVLNAYKPYYSVVPRI